MEQLLDYRVRDISPERQNSHLRLHLVELEVRPRKTLSPNEITSADWNIDYRRRTTHRRCCDWYCEV